MLLNSWFSLPRERNFLNTIDTTINWRNGFCDVGQLRASFFFTTFHYHAVCLLLRSDLNMDFDRIVVQLAKQLLGI